MPRKVKDKGVKAKEWQCPKCKAQHHAPLPIFEVTCRVCTNKQKSGAAVWMKPVVIG